MNRSFGASQRSVLALLAGTLLLGATTAAGQAETATRTPPPRHSIRLHKQEALRAYAHLPLSFIPNAGQADPRIRYYAQGSGYRFAFARSEAVLSLVHRNRGLTLGLRFVGARAQAAPEGDGQLAGKVNYLIGNDRSNWRTGLPTYGHVTYPNLWPGVDLLFRGGEGRLKYELLLRPGARARDIALAYRGIQHLSLDRKGNLRIHTRLGVLTDTRPRSYQVIGGKRISVESRFVLLSGGAYAFAVGRYDTRRPLVIDPDLVYSTYLGGSQVDSGTGIAVDATGNAYVTGWTASTDFPHSFGPYNGGIDAFVSKLNPAGTSLVYSTYLGGSLEDEGLAIALDSTGSAYVTGYTTSSNFPTKAALPPPSVASDTTANGGQDAFVTKLDLTGGLAYSTYLGGPGDDQGRGIAVNARGEAFVDGFTGSSHDFPYTPSALDNSYNGGNSDAFLTIVNEFGTGNAYSSYLGGSGDDQALAIAINGAGDAYLTGLTLSTNFPTTPGAFKTTFNGGLGDAFVTRFNFAGSGFGGYMFTTAYSTYLGGGGDDRGFGIAIDATGSAYVTGRTAGGFPTTPGAFKTGFGGAFDAFVTKLNPAGSSPLVYSTYLGGTGNDQGLAIALDSGGSAHVTGRTNSTNFQTSAGAVQTGNAGGQDAFLTKFNPAGSSPLVYSTYLGGSSTDQGNAITLDSSGAVYLTGFTNGGWPTTPGAFDTSFNGVSDAFVTKMLTVGAPATLLLTPATDTNPVGTPHTVTATVTDATGQPVAGVTVRFSVTGANPTSGSSPTKASGQATFTYTGTHLGTDTITAYADTNNNNTQDAGEPSGVATKIWETGPPASLTLEPPAAENTVGTQHTVTATVRDAFLNPVPNVTVRFSVSGANTASDSDVTDANGQATFTYTGTHAGNDTITAYADTNNNHIQDAGEPSGVATKTWTPGAPFRMTLEPAGDSNQVGEQHCVTATVYDAFGNPVPGIVVRFSVPTHVATFANPFSGSDTTDANGQAEFCFTASLPGTDLIHAYADTNNNGTQDAPPPVGDEPFADASKVWTLPTSTAFCEVTITDGGWIIAVNGDRANFGGNAKVSDDGSAVQGQEEYQDHGPADPMSVKSTELLATTCTTDTDPQSATIFGKATINGSGEFIFRIDVTDGGQGGSNDSYGIMLSTGYASGQQELQGGNVNIHKS